MTETVYTHHLEKRGRKRAAAAIEGAARYLYPTLLLLGILALSAHGLRGR